MNISPQLGNQMRSIFKGFKNFMRDQSVNSDGQLQQPNQQAAQQQELCNDFNEQQWQWDVDTQNEGLCQKLSTHFEYDLSQGNLNSYVKGVSKQRPPA